MGIFGDNQVVELDRIAKMLVRRDLELSAVRAEQAQQIYELDKIAKRLVRRDYELLQTNDSLRLLDEALAKTEALLDSIGDGVVATNPDGKIILINGSAANMLGIRREDALNKDWFSLAQTEDAKGNVISREERIMFKTLNNRVKLHDTDHLYVRANGAKFPAATTTSPVSIGGKNIGGVLVFRDITDEKAIERSKSEFISITSHQLRTPITSIKWSLDLAMNDKGLADIHRARLETLYIANERLIALVNNLLSLSRIEAGKLQVKKVVIDLTSIVNGAIDILTPGATAKQQKIIKDFKVSNCLANVDQLMFGEAFRNVLSNAISYGAKNSEITVSLNKVDKDYVISVHNVGSFIGEVDRAKLFFRFYRGELGNSRPDSTGLGLFIAKNAVEINGGKIWFESFEASGTTFFISVPAS